MNQEQIDNLKKQIERLAEADLADKIGETHPNQEVSQIRLGPFTATEVILFSERTINNFRALLDQDSSRFLSVDFFWGVAQMGIPRVGGSFEAPQKVSILDVTNQMNDALSSRNWDQYVNGLQVAVGFQILCGFWQPQDIQTKRRIPNRLSQVLEDLNLRKGQFVQLFTDIQAIKQSYDDAETKRQEELQVVAGELESAKNTVREITTLLQSAIDSNGQLTSLLSTQKTSVQTANSELGEIEKQREDVRRVIDGLTQTLDDAEKRLLHMQEKESWVNELAGTAAAGALGHKFETRRSQLGVSSGWWLFGTIASVICAAVWLGLSHKYFALYKDDVWQTLAFNFGLLLPAIFIVGFFAKQFSKVRQFEEEYAFRSAVAMTLGAFADRLKTENADYNKLILETVEKLYKLPVLLAEKKPSPGILGKANPADTVKSITDLLKEVKST